MKPKIVLTWASGCGGCEASLLDLGTELLEIAGRVEIVYWPLALDFKRERLDRLGDGELLAAWINGAIRTEAQEELAHLLRRKARLIFAHGTCAHLGGVLGLANRGGTGALLEHFRQTAPQGVGAEKSRAVTLPALNSRVRPLERVIKVDYTIPGCPPPPELNSRAFSLLLNGVLPPPGQVLAGNKALCHECPRCETRPEKIRWTRPARIHQIRWDPERCFLAMEIPCLGPATRGGCGSRCLRANMPCRGCFGPLDRVRDQGAKVIALLASLLENGEEKELEQLLEAFPDPLGLAYLYTLAASLLYGGEVPGDDETAY